MLFNIKCCPSFACVSQGARKAFLGGMCCFALMTMLSGVSWGT